MIGSSLRAGGHVLGAFGLNQTIYWGKLIGDECTENCEPYQYAVMFAVALFVVNMIALPLDVWHIYFGGFMKGVKGLEHAQSEKAQYLTIIPAVLNFAFTSVLQVLIVLYSLFNTYVDIITYNGPPKDSFTPSFTQRLTFSARQFFYSFLLPTGLLIPNYLLLFT